MLADRQTPTQRQTDTVITILRHPTGGEVDNEATMNLTKRHSHYKVHKKGLAAKLHIGWQ